MQIFSVHQASKWAKTSFPDLTRKTRFADLSKDSAHGQLRKWVESTHVDYRQHLLGGSSLSSGFLPRAGGSIAGFILGWTLERGPRAEGFGMRDPLSGNGIVAVPSHPVELRIGKNLRQQAAFAFGHELGHVIIPEAFPEYLKTLDLTMPAAERFEQLRAAESVADPFGAIYAIRENEMALDDVPAIASTRADNARRMQLSGEEGPLRLLTSGSLMHLYNNFSERDIRSFTPGDMIDAAVECGRHYKEAPLSSSEIADRVEGRRIVLAALG